MKSSIVVRVCVLDESGRQFLKPICHWLEIMFTMDIQYLFNVNNLVEPSSITAKITMEHMLESIVDVALALRSIVSLC